MKISIGSKGFKSKTEAQKHCKDLLNKFRPGDVVTEAEDIDFLWGAIQRHPDARAKIGHGVELFYVEADVFGGKRFCVRRVDNTTTHFSYPKCFRPPTAKEEVSKAFRKEVLSQILDFKQRSFGDQLSITCSLTGAPVTWETSQVDHFDPDFWVLRDNFIADRSFESIELYDDETGSGKLLKDRAFALSWFVYHQQFANLRITSIEANQTRPRRRRE